MTPSSNKNHHPQQHPFILVEWWKPPGKKHIAVGAKILESNAIWILFIPWDCRKQILWHVQTLLIWRIQLYQKPTTNTIAQHVPCNIFIHFPNFSLASATGLLTCTLLQSLIGPFRKPPHENSSDDSPDLWTPRRLFICNETLTLRRLTWRSEKSVLVAPPEKWCKLSNPLKPNQWSENFHEAQTATIQLKIDETNCMLLGL